VRAAGDDAPARRGVELRRGVEDEDAIHPGILDAPGPGLDKAGWVVSK
jgi:hypothetical protein